MFPTTRVGAPGEETSTITQFSQTERRGSVPAWRTRGGMRVNLAPKWRRLSGRKNKGEGGRVEVLLILESFKHTTGNLKKKVG